ncbi:unnamed protein product [Lactuca saligna]|uniref:RING-type domain-containing protein n=1 Tax=Lactuca saligna TaxID=75948 RepID=A0AA35Z1C4_LACSI|nr:unnamed protein product [Lactuca saligna]
MTNLLDIALYLVEALVCIAALVLFASCTKLCYQCYGLVIQDIETRRIPPTRTLTATHVPHHPVLPIQQANLDRQAGAQPNGYLGKITQEQIYDSSTCKNDNCVICLKDFKKTKTIQLLVSCQHSFHGHCINKWLLVNGSCPICREAIRS